MNATQIIADKINSAFSAPKNLTDNWIESNPYIFEELTDSEAKEYIPGFMVFVLKNMNSTPGSNVYVQLLNALNNFSKCKHPPGLWFSLSTKEKSSVLAFLGHLLHNQPANIDEQLLIKIISRWQQVT